MPIALNPEQERLLHLAMRQGSFQSVDEVLDEALRSILLASEEQEPASSMASTTAEAVTLIRDLRKGNRLPDNLSIRAMIEDGRA